MNRNAINVWFLAVFALMLAAPLIQMATHALRYAPLEERRQPHALTAVTERLLAGDAQLPADIDAWFDDHYGLRDLLIRLRHEADYQLFGASDKVLIGKDGWLYAKDALADIRRNNETLPAHLPAILAGVQNFKACLAARGVTLAIVYFPDKASVYPAHLPDSAPRPAPGLAQEMARAFAAQKDLIFIDGEAIFAQHGDEQVFYKTDLHVNDRGAELVDSALVARIARASHKAVPPLRALRYAEVSWGPGSETRFLGKVIPLREITRTVTNRFTVLGDDANGRWTKAIGKGPVEGYPDMPVIDYRYDNLRARENLLPPTVIFGTSFSDLFFDLGFHEAFSAVYRTHDNVFARVVPLARALPRDAKFFVIEYPEMFASTLEGLKQVRCADVRAATPSAGASARRAAEHP